MEDNQPRKGTVFGKESLEAAKRLLSTMSDQQGKVINPVAGMRQFIDGNSALKLMIEESLKNSPPKNVD